LPDRMDATSVCLAETGTTEIITNWYFLLSSLIYLIWAKVWTDNSSKFTITYCLAWSD
jgi:hypothetical protein